MPFTRPWRPLDQTRRPTSTRAADLRPVWRSGLGCVVLTALASNAFAQNALTWSDVRARLQASNPMLQAGRLTIEESKADEITAYLRPNPDWVVTFDQVGTTEQGTPFSGSTLSTAVSYLHERRRKRISLAIERAIVKAEGVHPAFAKHLRNHLHTGSEFSYTPAGSVTWAS